jgi:mRNA interferase RelE/StbE
MYRIKLTRITAESLNKLEKKTRQQIISKIELLKNDPLLSGKQLKGPLKELRSIRAAGQRYRIIYRVIESEIIVVIITVGIRKEGDKKDIYELMKKYIKTGLMET